MSIVRPHSLRSGGRGNVCVCPVETQFNVLNIFIWWLNHWYKEPNVLLHWWESQSTEVEWFAHGQWVIRWERELGTNAFFLQCPPSIWPALALDHSITNSPSFLTVCEASWLNVTFSLNYQNQEVHSIKVPSIECCVMTRPRSRALRLWNSLDLPCSTEVTVAT